MDIVEAIANDIYDNFEAWLDDATFVYLTEEEAGPCRKTLITRAELAVCAIRGVEYDDYVNECIDENITYNEIFCKAQELSHDVMLKLLKRYTGGNVG